ncbi:MAG: acyl-CoA dehydratase activase-related protein [Promethearchaeota archaeon]
MTQKLTDTLVSEQKLPRYKIGIPRALYFYKYGPLWTAFLEYLNCEVKISGPTTSVIVENGAKEANTELCVPMKIYFGHVKALISEYPDLDYIFIPRYVSSHKEQFFCPKFLILPEAVKYGIKFDTPIITLEINVKKFSEYESAIIFGNQLGFNKETMIKAWDYANKKFEEFQDEARNGDYIELLNRLDTNPKHKRKKKKFKQFIPESIKGKFPVNILVLGHPYNVYETHINIDLIGRLKAMDCNVTTIENLPKSEFNEKITINEQYHQYWQSEDEILKTARYYLKDGRRRIDGIIFLISFACGPDSLIQEIVMRDMKQRKVPYLDLVLDEHSGESGLITRIESFVDMIRREKFR